MWKTLPTLEHWAEDLDKATINNEELSKIQEELNKITEEFQEIQTGSNQYLRDNRLHLSDTIFPALEEIDMRAWHIDHAAYLCMKNPAVPLRNSSAVGYLFSCLGDEVMQRVPKEAMASLMVGQLHVEYDKIVKEVEKLYKSVAEAK